VRRRQFVPTQAYVGSQIDTVGNALETSKGDTKRSFDFIGKMIVSSKRTSPSSKRPLKVVSPGNANSLRLVPVSECTAVECPKLETGAIAHAGHRRKSLGSSLLIWLMEGFALYAASAYSMQGYQQHDVESDCLAMNEGDGEDEESKRLKEVVAEAERIWAALLIY
jgi:hypothetical protein